MRQLIVNADDFGLTEAVSDGILDAHRKGIVTSTTPMANGGAFGVGLSISRRTPLLGIGVHLNLTEDEPVSPPLTIPSLVDRNGRLHLSPGRLLRAMVTRQVNIADVEAELRRHIIKAHRAGILPAHLDGHKHEHVLPGISDVVVRLAQEFSIPRVRCPREEAPNLPSLLRNGSSRTAVIRQCTLGWIVSGFAGSFKKELADAGLLCPVHFYDLSQAGFLHTESILDILAHLSDGVSELMCHPGYLDTDFVSSGTRLLFQREIEVRALTADIVRTHSVDLGIQLISYRQVTCRREHDDSAKGVTSGSERFRPLRQMVNGDEEEHTIFNCGAAV